MGDSTKSQSQKIKTLSAQRLMSNSTRSELKLHPISVLVCFILDSLLNTGRSCVDVSLSFKIQ